ncbi:MAG: hypothetical protein KME27_10660 [Lyngbya sp. HA4199-MV5]|jgi:hypothetical protein|nr:hypothetical protein [Lyngbya sp. HA4199-MV5]
MSREFNKERAAKALVDAILMGDRAAAEKYEVTVKSIEGWRVRLETDSKFREFFRDLRQAKDEQWAEDLPAALASCINFLKQAGQQADPAKPEAIAAITGAAETLADIALTQKMVDERLRAARAEREATE